MNANSGSPPQRGQQGWCQSLNSRLGQQGFGATREKRPHRQKQHLIQQFPLVTPCVGSAARGGHRGLIPTRHHHLELPVAGQGLEAVLVGQFEGFEPAEDIGRLADHQPEVGPVDRNVLELQHRPALTCCLACGDRMWPRAAGLWIVALLRPQQLDLHVGRRGQIGLRVLQLAQFPHFARLAGLGVLPADPAVVTCLRSGHVWIVGHRSELRTASLGTLFNTARAKTVPGSFRLPSSKTDPGTVLP